MRAAEAEAMAQVLADAIEEVSVHDDDPGDDGSNEITGTTRQAITWAADDEDGVITGTVTFALTEGQNIAYFGFWDSSNEWVHGQQFTYAVEADDDYEFNIAIVVPVGNGIEEE